MPDRHLHIISFDVPYPPVYGGVIDVFHKIRMLNQLGIKVILHCFEYGRKEVDVLSGMCEKVYLYPRLTGISSALKWRPYIVESRRSADLMNNLLRDQHPILFEGLHSCYYLSDPRLGNRFKIYRESNLEHRYYYHLSKAEPSPWKKIFFLISGIKLYFYQKVIRHADLILTVSDSDSNYLSQHFPEVKVVNIPSFHAADDITSLVGKGTYILYHGNLAVPENEKAACFLIEDVFSKITFPIIIAGRNPSDTLKRKAAPFSHIKIIGNPDGTEMAELIRRAHAHILFTFQATGLKLKLLNALFNGRFCIVNQKMLEGTGLENLCLLANEQAELIKQINQVVLKDFDEETVAVRKLILMERYSNRSNAERLAMLIFQRPVN